MPPKFSKKMKTDIEIARSIELVKIKQVGDVINRTAEWQPNTPLEKYRQLLPDRWEKAND